MTDTLSLNILPNPPKEFIRGQTLEFLMELPPEVPAGFFKAVNVDTTLLCHLRKAEDASEDGLISELLVQFTDPPACTELRFTLPPDTDTSTWPLGLAEFDVRFTRNDSSQIGVITVTKVFRSLPVQFKIVDGITNG